MLFFGLLSAFYLPLVLLGAAWVGLRSTALTLPVRLMDALVAGIGGFIILGLTLVAAGMLLPISWLVVLVGLVVWLVFIYMLDSVTGFGSLVSAVIYSLGALLVAVLLVVVLMGLWNWVIAPNVGRVDVTWWPFNVGQNYNPDLGNNGKTLNSGGNPTNPVVTTRRSTKDASGDQLSFKQGENAFGATLEFSNGQSCNVCYVVNSPVAGIVHGGIVGMPNVDEISSQHLTQYNPSGSIAVNSTPSSGTDQYNIPPQQYIPNPSLYLSTGVPGPFETACGPHCKTWDFTVIDGTTAVVGGFRVDGVENGVYKAYRGPFHLHTTVTDGFVSVVQNKWDLNEWCFRLAQTVQFGWAHQHLSPLNGWNCAVQ